MLKAIWLQYNSIYINSMSSVNQIIDKRNFFQLEYIYVCTYVCVYVYMHIYIHTYTQINVFQIYVFENKRHKISHVFSGYLQLISITIID